MIQKQKTIKSTVKITGVGLHTGEKVTLSYHPAPENHGYKFKRIDIDGCPILPALADNVIETNRGTTIEKNGVRIHTVEHALAAAVGLEIDNLIIEMDGPEAPIMDGSAKVFVDALDSVGLMEQNANRKYFDILEPITFTNDSTQSEIIALPYDGFRVSVMVDYDSPVLGPQHASLDKLSDFKDEIAPSRTFVFLHELESLLSKDLIKGGDLDNAIVVVDKELDESGWEKLVNLFEKPDISIGKQGILNNIELNFQNEPARHKLLDVIGDLALIGVPINAHIIAKKPGHLSNVGFAKMIRELIKKEKNSISPPFYDPNAIPAYDVNQIKGILPHRDPFLLIDKIIDISASHVIGLKNVTSNEPYFQGHFPNKPIMPGVLQIEAMAQAGGILCLNTVPDPENYLTYFLKIDKVKFKSMVVPGDTIVFRLDLITPIRRGICHMAGTAYVGNKVVMEGELMAQIVKTENE